MLALATLVFLGLIVAAVVSVGALIVRAAFWRSSFRSESSSACCRCRCGFGKTLLRLTFGMVLVPVLLVVGILVAVVAAIAALVAIVTPLLPLAIVAFLIWMVFRSFGRPVAA